MTLWLDPFGLWMRVIELWLWLVVAPVGAFLALCWVIALLTPASKSRSRP